MLKKRLQVKGSPYWWHFYELTEDSDMEKDLRIQMYKCNAAQKSFMNKCNKCV